MLGRTDDRPPRKAAAWHVAPGILEDELKMSLAARYEDRYRPRGNAPGWNPVLETLLNHRSVRCYSGQPLPAGLPELLVAAAQSAPPPRRMTATITAEQCGETRKAEAGCCHE